MKRIALSALFLALALPGLAQEPQTLEERIDVNAVLLDVLVTDNRGNHILGLSKDDFIVKEDGVEQPVDSVDYFTNRRLLDQREESAPFKVERVLEDRYFIFFFDKPDSPSSLQGEISLARGAVRDFIRKEMKETDRIAIVGHDVRLKVYSDFTSDKQQLERAVNDAVKFGRGVTEAPSGEGPSILRSVDVDSMIESTGTVYQAIDFLADGLKSIRARKNLILFSPGIADRFETVSDGMLMSRSPDFDPMLETLNAANTSVYGVQLQRDLAPTAAPAFHQRLEEMSKSTGGNYFRFNTGYSATLARVENTNSGYYLVTYRARHNKGDRGYQNVSVSVRNRELKVVARSGYQFGG
jgi:VWFA-related protein